jgi:hypothetical protein
VGELTRLVLDDVRAQLQLLLDADVDAPRLMRLRDAPRVVVESPLGAGVLQLRGLVIYFTMSAWQVADDVESIEFELEYSTEDALPPDLVLTCVIGRSRAELPIHDAGLLTWRTRRADVINPRTKRVAEVVLTLGVGGAAEESP